MEEKYSEDYEHLLRYHDNPTPDIAAEEADFFEKKYNKLINHYCMLFLRFGKTSSLKHANTDKIDFEERYGFTRDQSFLQQEKKYFTRRIGSYVARAVEHFNPDKVNEKENYSFAYYLKLWLKTGLRDIRRKYNECLVKEIPNNNYAENESTLIERIDAEIMNKNLVKVLKSLSPLDKKICDELSEGKKQNEIQIQNPETGNLYSASYICKRIKSIRSVMLRYGLEEF